LVWAILKGIGKSVLEQVMQLSDLPKDSRLESGRFRYLFKELNTLVGRIITRDFRDLTEATLKVAPAAFWTRECSKKYHPVDERGLYGNLVHTIRVGRVVLVIVDACGYSRWTIDRVLSGAILHDVCRHGLDGKSQYSDKEHPRLVRQLMDNNRIGLNSPAREEMLEDIEKHMGRWDNPSYAPGILPSEVLHLADAVDAKLVEVK